MARVLLFSEFSDKIIKLFNSYGCEPCKVWLGPYFGVGISKPEDIQVIIFKKSHKDLFK